MSSGLGCSYIHADGHMHTQAGTLLGSLYSLCAQGRPQREEGYFSPGFAQAPQLLCTVDQLYFPWSRFRPRLSLAILKPTHCTKEEGEEASWGKFTKYDGEVILDKKGLQ